MRAVKRILTPFEDREVGGFIRPVSFEVAAQPDGTALAFTGFPLDNTTPISAKGFVAAYHYHGTTPDEVLIDKNAWPGASGSPLYLANGRVVGMMTKTGTGAASGLSHARAAARIVAFLRAHP